MALFTGVYLIHFTTPFAYRIYLQMTGRDTLVLPLPPSCVACSSKFPDCVVIGTYFLQQDDKDEQHKDNNSKPQTRKGSLIVHKLDGHTL